MSAGPARLRISTVVLAHRTADYLGDALRSVTEQLPGDFEQEVILVKNFHDASIDVFCRERGVRNLFTDAESALGKLRLGLLAASGEVLTFLDYDDLYAPGRLRAVAEAFRTDPRLGYFHNGIEVIGADGERLPRHHLPYTLRRLGGRTRRFEVRDADKPRSDPRLGGCRPDFNTGAMAVRRDVAERCEPYLERLHLMFDSLLYYAAWSSPYDLVIDPEPLTRYRIHTGNSSVVRTTDGRVLERPGFAAWRASDQRVTEELALASGRPELVRDVELRQRRERLVEALRDPTGDRRRVIELLRERRPTNAPAGSRLLRIQLAAYLLSGLLAPSLARRLVDLSR